MKKRLLSLVLTLAMLTSLFAGMGVTASAAGRIIDITQEANLTVTNKIANIYYVQGLREYHEQRDANNWTKFFGQWAWVLSESDARAKLNELMRSPSSMDSQPSTLSVNSPNNEPANFHLNGEKADTLLIWAKAQPMSVNEGGYYYALLPMPKEIIFTTNLNSSYSISSVDSKTLTVEATCADYDGEPTYQWYYCGTTSSKDSATPIDGATGKSCTVKPATAKEPHYYFCRVTAGEVVGDSVVASVYASDPYVYINNTDKLYGTCYAVTGKPYTMGITNTSNNVASGELCYQWYRCTDSEGTGAEAIEGATTDSFDVPTGTKGTYYYFGKAYIKLNGSEICSAQTQVAKVIVRDAHKITPVGTPGEDGYTIVEGGKFYFTGYSLQDDLTCPTNETCKLTYEPDDGYTVDKILVYKTGEPETTVYLEEWDSDTKEFTMPDFDITVEVTFKKPEPIEKVDLTVDWSRVPSIGVGDNVFDDDVRFNEYYDWAVFVDGAGTVNGPIGGYDVFFTIKVTDSNKTEICNAIVDSGFDGLTPDGLTDMLEMLGCGDWLHPEFLFSIDGYVVKENDVLAIMPFVYPYSGYFPMVNEDAPFGAYNGTVTCNGETVSNSAVFVQGSMSMLIPFIEVGTVSDLAAKKNAAKTEVFDVFYYDEIGYTTGGSYGAMPGIAAAGETITIRVNPDEGYEVDTVTWQPFVMASDEGDDVNVVTPVDGKYTFTMPAQSVMVKVTFKATATEPGEQPGGEEDKPYVITLNTTGVINGAAGVWFYNADNTDGEDDYYLMPSPGETVSKELEFNTDSADVVVGALEGYAFETLPVVTVNGTPIEGTFEDGIYVYNIAEFTGNTVIMVTGTAVAVGGDTEPDDDGSETNNIENLGEEIFSIDEEGNVTFNIPTDDGYIYYTLVLPAAALEGSGITAEQYVEYYMEGTKHPIIDVTDSSVFDLSNMEAVAALTHSGTGQVYVTNAAVDGTNYPWTISSDSIIAVMKLSADNMVSGAYGAEYFPGLGFTNVYAYGIHGVYADIVEFGGSGDSGEVDDGFVAELGEDWISRSGNTVTINVPNGEKYMLGIVNHADNEDSEYYRDYFNDFIGQQILTSKNFEDEYDNYSYVAIYDGEMEGEYGYVGINELLTSDGTPIVLNITEDQSIFLFHVSTNPFLNSYGYKAYAILGVHAEAYIYDANAPIPHEHSYTYTANNNGTHNGTCECGEDAIENEACTYVDGKCEKCGYSKPVTPPVIPPVTPPVIPPVIPPVHVHSYTYTSNNNGTHNGACACGEDAIVNEACTYVGDKCEKCGYSEPVTPPAHEHSYTYTSNNNGTHNGTCDCGEAAIVNQACIYVGGKCEKCGYVEPVTPPAHEHSYTYTSNNNGTHNGTCDCGEAAIVNQACIYVGGKCEKCGYVEPVTPPTVNVPVSNNENKVGVEAEISGNDATIKPLDEEQIDKLVGSENASGDVVIDLSKLDENIDTAGIPKATLEAIVNAAEDTGNKTEHLVIKLSTAELKLDDTAMRAIVDQANGDVIKFNFDDVGLDRLNATQKDAVKDMDVRKGYEAYITVNDQRIGDFKGGEVEIIVPYAVPEGENLASFSVWYVDDDGTLEKQQSTYDGKEKCFIVTHFSDYVIVYSAEDAPQTEGGSMWILWIILIILVCVTAYFIYKKRQARKNRA